MPAAPRRKRLLTYANVRAGIGQFRDEASASADPTLMKLFEGLEEGCGRGDKFYSSQPRMRAPPGSNEPRVADSTLDATNLCAQLRLGIRRRLMQKRTNALRRRTSACATQLKGNTSRKREKLSPEPSPELIVHCIQRSSTQSPFTVETQLSTYPLALSAASRPCSQDIAMSPFSTLTLQSPQDPDLHP